ncbi:Uu.00g120480.m01.CDS01 [Anthostomella pinea]|uniref:Uu.00g120480.m01.CDS01 n=1 Tax=Anthostomella pinea TaxID=933095 RepID=A0AAI8VGR4_9PEZI|nr:Uu.00g120480.m01.CDS01 [Anthostomella pinea]
MSATASSRSRSPPTQSARPSSEHQLAMEKQQSHHTIPCEKCESKTSEKVTRFDVPLIAIPRLVNALLGFATVIRIHTAIDAGWWPWEHKVLFVLCWVLFFWNLLHGFGSILGYAYWPSSRRTAGLPPVTIVINGRTIVSFGGPDEDEGERRRRMKRIQFTIIDLILTIPTLALLIYSAHIMYPWWGSRYVGLWSPTIGLIASLVSCQFVTAFFQMFQFFEAKVIGVQLTMQDLYERDHPVGRLQL